MSSAGNPHTTSGGGRKSRFPHPLFKSLFAPLKLFLFGVLEKKEGWNRPVKTPVSAPDSVIYMGKEDFPALGRILDEWAARPENARSEYSLLELAYGSNVNAESVRDYFDIYLNVRFRTWKMEKRIRTAQRLLLHKEIFTVTEAAEASGFKDKSNFYRQFKRVVGCTPKEWRESDGHPFLPSSF